MPKESLGDDGSFDGMVDVYLGCWLAFRKGLKCREENVCPVKEEGGQGDRDDCWEATAWRCEWHEGNVQCL